VVERSLDGGAVILCSADAVPRPGQFLGARAIATADVLATALFPRALRGDGFESGPGLPSAWIPGTELEVWGPLGHGFDLPLSVKRVALAALSDSPARLLPLIEIAVGQGAAVVLVAESAGGGLRNEVEVQPRSGLADALRWADYAALDVDRHQLAALGRQLRAEATGVHAASGQVLVVAPMPCLGAGECGACSLSREAGWKLLCRDGPVLSLGEVMRLAQ
jgi:hypothetical protein